MSFDGSGKVRLQLFDQFKKPLGYAKYFAVYFHNNSPHDEYYEEELICILEDNTVDFEILNKYSNLNFQAEDGYSPLKHIKLEETHIGTNATILELCKAEEKRQQARLEWSKKTEAERLQREIEEQEAKLKQLKLRILNF